MIVLVMVACKLVSVDSAVNWWYDYVLEVE